MVLLGIVSVGCLSAQQPDWSSRKMAELDRILAMEKPEERISLLGPFMGIAAYGRESMSEDQTAVFERARDALVSVPGHARFYQERINRCRSEVQANAQKPGEEIARLEREGKWTGLGDYETIRKQAFQILRELQSAETVSVLGDFLDDPEGRDRKNLLGLPVEISGTRKFGPNCLAASVALSNLGIEHPPSEFRRDFGYAGSVSYINDEQLREVDAWKDWWNEVEAGKRTYRFIGSSIEYGPDGPASAEALKRIALADKRDAQRAGGKMRAAGQSGDEGEKPEGRSGVVIWTVSLVLLAGLLGLGWKKIRTAG